MNRKKLTIAEQISDMHQKGITFHYTEEQDVSRFLKYNNYYFKLKSYGKNYDKYNSTEKKGQYLNLDFSYLQELSTLGYVFTQNNNCNGSRHRTCLKNTITL